MVLEERIKKCLEEGGVVLSEDGKFEEINSINFIDCIISLEDEFNIQIPDEYLLVEFLSDLQTTVNLVSSLISNKSN